jgi:hypothetical protein
VRATAATFLALCLVAFVSAAAAQEHDARGHFRRGIEHYNEGSYDAALAEFQQAYEIAPAHQVLYNIARVHAALGNAVEAASAYQRYLDEGEHQLSAERRREVEQALEVQRARIGRLDVRVSVDGATIAVDGDDVATSPLREPLRVTAGEVELEVRAANHQSVRRRLRVAGGVVERIVIDLVEASTPGILRIHSAVPDVLVEVDGEAVGTTPFDSTVTLSVGSHRLTARRAGYRTFERTLTIDRGAEAEVHVDMVRDEFADDDEVGRLALALPHGASYTARIDGEPVGASAFASLPRGRHRLELEVDERLPFAETVEIEAGQATELRPDLEWTATARQERVDAASTRRAFGIGLSAGGLALVGGGLGVLLWNYSEISETNQAIDDWQIRWDTECVGREGTEPCVALRTRGEGLNANRSDQTTVEVVSWIVAAAGGLSLIAGLYLWLTSPSDESIDDAASAKIDFVPLRGGGLFSARVPL